MVSQAENLEKKLPTLCPPTQASSASYSYAQAASAQPASSAPARTGPANDSLLPDSRTCNLVLFGLPETDSILELKSEVDELLKYLSGKSVSVNDVFRLGKYSASSSKRPRPLLIKLAMIWDRKIFLLQTRKLRNYKTPHLFLRENVSLDHRLRQKVLRALPKDKASVVVPSEKPLSLHSSETSNSDSQLVRSDSPAASSCSSSSPTDPSIVRSVSPAVSLSSSTSTSTILQGPHDLQNGST